MSIQAIQCSCVGGRLALSYEIHAAAKGLLVAVATDSEFLSNYRLFLIPPHIQSLHLDVGNPASVGGFVKAAAEGAAVAAGVAGSNWYVRVGGLMGDEFHGVVDWSGIHGPTFVMSAKPVPKEPLCSLSLLHTQAIKEGVRLHTGHRDPLYALLEFSVDTRFPASLTKTTYMLDVGHGYHDCFGLDTVNTYSVRIRTWGLSKGKPGGNTFPTEDLRPLSVALVAKEQQALRPGKPTSSGDLSATRAGTMVINEARESGRMRFATSGDYMRYLAAKAKTSEGRKAV